jgi:hypothetical protein
VQIFAESSTTELSMLALIALTKGLEQRWRDITFEDKLAQFSFLSAKLLDSPSPSLARILTQTVCRYVRLGWLEDTVYRDLVTKLAMDTASIVTGNPPWQAAPDSSISPAVEPLLVTSQDHGPFINTPSGLFQLNHSHSQAVYSLALKFFQELIWEVLLPVKCRPLSMHRRVAASFKDLSLGLIFNCAYSLLCSHLAPSLRLSTLEVLCACLSYDFLSTAQESADDSLGLPIPLPWASAIQDPRLLTCIQETVLEASAAEQTLALRVLSHLGAVRRAVFKSALQTVAYTEQYLQVLTYILQGPHLAPSQSFEVTQAIRRFTLNFKLKEISCLPNFKPWLQELAQYTARACRHPDAISSQYSSMMSAWNFLAKEACPPLVQHVAELLRTLLNELITATLQGITAEDLTQLQQSCENDLQTHIESIANCCLVLYDWAMTELLACLTARSTGLHASSPDSLIAQVSWLILTISQLLSLSDKKSSKDSFSLDQGAVLQILQIVGGVEGRVELETAFTYFFSVLHKVYVNSPRELSWHFSTESSQTPQVLALIMAKL